MKKVYGLFQISFIGTGDSLIGLYKRRFDAEVALNLLHDSIEKDNYDYSYEIKELEVK